MVEGPAGWELWFVAQDILFFIFGTEFWFYEPSPFTLKLFSIASELQVYFTVLALVFLPEQLSASINDFRVVPGLMLSYLRLKLEKNCCSNSVFLLKKDTLIYTVWLRLHSQIIKDVRFCA